MARLNINSRRIPRFVEEYAKNPNATQAALEAGFPESWASSAGYELLKIPEVLAQIEQAKAENLAEVKFDAQDILRQWMLLATADPSKISRTRWVNCRHCWGVGHDYQWKAREYAEACEHASKQKKPEPPPSCSGGFGYVSNADPNPACPECHGEGIESVIFADMSTLGPAERKLIASVKRTKDGLEVKMRDQDAAVKNLAQYAGMLVERKELTGKNGQPLIPTMPTELPADAATLQTLYGEMTKG